MKISSQNLVEFKEIHNYSELLNIKTLKEDNIKSIQTYINDLYKGDSEILGLYIDNVLVAAIIYTFYSNMDIRINLILVSKEHRGKGYGKMILQHLIDEYKNDKQNIILSVDINNKSAINLYKTLGFKDKFKRGKYVYMQINE